MRKAMIIGGGASGIMAAISAARNGADVTLLEHKDRIGKKILMTGNGKCNLSNLSFSGKNYYSDYPELMSSVFQKFAVEDTMQFFEGLGLLTKEKKGYVYPMSEQASSVLDVLRSELKRLHVATVTECDIKHINRTKNGFSIQSNKGTYECSSLVIACGSKAAPQTGSDGSGYTLAKKFGHHVIAPLPALVQLRCTEDYMKSVAGVRCEANISVKVDGKQCAEESGELQVTDYGISGIPVFQISRIVSKALHEKKKVMIDIDLMPTLTEEEIYHYLLQLRKEKSCTVEEALAGMINKKLLGMILKLNQIKGTTDWKSIGNNQLLLEKIVASVKRWTVHINQTNPFQNAQVCCGGIDCSEVMDTMESKKVKNLYFAGEILDVDGICGGYNLQWAWSSGYLAGMNAARRSDES